MSVSQPLTAFSVEFSSRLDLRFGLRGISVETKFALADRARLVEVLRRLQHGLIGLLGSGDESGHVFGRCLRRVLVIYHFACIAQFSE